MNFRNGEKTEQLEDQHYRGKISARYLFKGDQVIGQEQVADADPPSIAAPFTAVEEELKSIASYGSTTSAEDQAVATRKPAQAQTTIK